MNKALSSRVNSIVLGCRQIHSHPRQAAISRTKDASNVPRYVYGNVDIIVSANGDLDIVSLEKECFDWDITHSGPCSSSVIAPVHAGLGDSCKQSLPISW